MPKKNVAKRAASETSTLSALEKELRAKLAQGESAAWRAGKLFHEIATSGLYKIRHESLERYANEAFPEYAYPTLKVYRRVAMHFPERTAIEQRVYKLEAGLRYVEATPETERSADVPGMDIELADGQTKPFGECSIAEIEQAIDHVKKKASAEKKRALPRGAGGLLSRLAKELKKSAPDEDDRATLRSEVAREGGRARVYVTVRAPLDKLLAVGRAITRALKVAKG